MAGSSALGESSQKSSPLNQVRLNLTYFYRQTYGLNFGWQNTWGKANPLLYPPAPVTGSANGKPNSNAFIIEADWVPFGKDNSWGRPFANLNIGLQYVIYTRFNGGTTNYDGFGRNASGNNTLFLYSWLEF
ncbi:MAG: cytochrome c [Acetobacteraceae bacterium]|nr:cytochrome c [Acetobacteraceae bacterium]